MPALFPAPESAVHAFLRALNRQDAQAMQLLMADDHRMIDALANALEGREAVHQAWKQYFRMVPDYTVAIEEIYTEGPAVVFLGTAQGTFTADGRLRPENRWQTPLAVRALVDDGKITEWRIYADNEPMREILRRSAS
jgi:uncharacterized protein (TIGR02246 family)